MFNKLYKFTGKKRILNPNDSSQKIKLKQIKYVNGDHKGELGGWIESKKNFEFSYIDENTTVYGKNSEIVGVSEIRNSYIFNSNICHGMITNSNISGIIVNSSIIEDSNLIGDIAVRQYSNIYNAIIMSTKRLSIIHLHTLDRIIVNNDEYDIITNDEKDSLKYILRDHLLLNNRCCIKNLSDGEFNIYRFKRLLYNKNNCQFTDDDIIYIEEQTDSEFYERYIISHDKNDNYSILVYYGDKYADRLNMYYETFFSISITSSDFDPDDKIKERIRDKIFNLTGIHIPENALFLT